MSVLKFKFEQLDSWFFKEARPMEAIGGSELGSIFPPQTATLAGAIRTLIGDSLGLDWQAYNKGELIEAQGIDLRSVIGQGENTGDLTYSYPCIEVYTDGQWQALAPMPSDLLVYKDKSDPQAVERLVKLHIGDVVECDLGKVRLPEVDVIGAKTLENCWLTQKGWQQYLNNELPDHQEVVSLDELVAYEPRLGISIDKNSGIVNDGMLYQTEHMRFHQGRFEQVALSIKVGGCSEQLHSLLSNIGESGSVKLGGEGRQSFVSISEVKESDQKIALSKNLQASLTAAKTAKLVFTSPCYFDSEMAWLPSDFELKGDEVQSYRGQIKGCGIDIISCCTSKPLRLGGWDVAKNQPKPLRSFIPAGSCWYIKTVQLAELITHLEHDNIGQLEQFGYGNALCLPWQE